MPYPDNIVYTAHAIEQIDRRGISPGIVEAVLENGEIIEEYDSDEEARYLMHFSWEEESFPLHFHVVAADQACGRTMVITAYDPTNQPDRWDDDFKTRLD